MQFYTDKWNELVTERTTGIERFQESFDGKISYKKIQFASRIYRAM